MNHSKVQQRIDITGAAGTSLTRHHTWNLPGKWYVPEAYIEVDTSVTAHASDVTDVSWNNGATELFSWNTGSGADGALTSGTRVNATPAQGTGRVISYGDQLKFIKTDGGSGKAFTGALIIVAEQLPLP